MEPIQIFCDTLAVLPDVDAVRPAACPRCDHPSRRGGRLRLHGHGPRWRLVALPGAAQGRARLVRCWVRRYRCTVCKATCSVLPDGVVLGLLYSTASMIAAWLGITPRPVGKGLPHDSVYAHQGVDRLRPERHRSGRRRWRCLRRWAQRFLTNQPGTTWSQRVQAFLIGHALRGAAM